MNIDEQERILAECIRQGTHLAEALARRGLTYDDLVYRFEAPVINSSPPFVPLDEMEQLGSKIPLVSFFSGTGGMDLGFERAGFSHLACFEINRIFCDTLRANRPEWTVLGPPDSSGDLHDRDWTEGALRGLGISDAFEGVFVGGPPCQSFSIAANQRFSREGDNFKRIGFAHEEYGNLLFEYIHYIRLFRPRVFLVENVPGLMTVDGAEQLKEAIAVLRESGYSVARPMLLNAADYGVPQDRVRFFLVGWRDVEPFSIPQPTLGRLPCSTVLTRGLVGAPNHVTREHMAESVARYVELRVGQRDQLGRVDRLDPNSPSKTVIAGGASGGGRSHLHPFIPRTLSVRESARLQSFPDDYRFCGTTARQFTQVGNAVPPLLAYHLARSVAAQFGL